MALEAPAIRRLIGIVEPAGGDRDLLGFGKQIAEFHALRFGATRAEIDMPRANRPSLCRKRGRSGGRGTLREIDEDTVRGRSGKNVARRGRRGPSLCQIDELGLRAAMFGAGGRCLGHAWRNLEQAHAAQQQAADPPSNGCGVWPNMKVHEACRILRPKLL